MMFSLVLKIPTLIFVLLFAHVSANKENIQNNNLKKDVRDYTDSDLERLYEQWEENDDDELPEDEKPGFVHQIPSMSVEELKKTSTNPDDLMRLSKKGQSVMMFVSVINPENLQAKPDKTFTSKMLAIWQSNLNNNHIDVQIYAVDDDRLLFMFKDGSQAWEARDFLRKQNACKEVVLEGQTTKGLGFELLNKQEL